MKTLIIYSTKYGSVAKVAEKLADVLGNDVCTVNVKSSPNLSNYDTIILGGSIYAGNIQKEMRQFIKEKVDVLKTKKIGLFICAGTPKNDIAESYLKKSFHPILYQKAVATENLGYEYDLKRFSFFDRLIVRIVGVKKSESKFFDDKITAFAAKIQQ